jgi:hypothetical protein
MNEAVELAARGRHYGFFYVNIRGQYYGYTYVVLPPKEYQRCICWREDAVLQ